MRSQSSNRGSTLLPPREDLRGVKADHVRADQHERAALLPLIGMPSEPLCSGYDWFHGQRTGNASRSLEPWHKLTRHGSG